MTSSSQRILSFVVALIGGLLLLTALLWLFTRPLRLTISSPPASPTPWIVATVDKEPILYDEWQQAIALDNAMSTLVGQAPPALEETLNQLVNQHLILREAEKAGLPEADPAQAEAWLAGFLMSLNLEETALRHELDRHGLTRDDLVDRIVPRLLRVERSLEELPPDGDSDAWVAGLLGQAQVVFPQNVAVPEPLNTRTPMTDPTAQSSEPLPRAASSPGPRVGEQAPDFNLEAIDGAIVRLSDLRGQPVILNFWAPWCVPCREALPILQAARNDDLNILGIAVRESRDSVLASAAELGLEFPLLLDQNGQVSDAYQVRGLPVSLFVDPEGTIRIRHVGPLDQATLEGYLAVLLPTAPAFPPAP